MGAAAHKPRSKRRHHRCCGVAGERDEASPPTSASCRIKHLRSVLLKKGNGIASVLTELFLVEFGLVVPIGHFFLRVIECASDMLDLLVKIVHERPDDIKVIFL